MDSDSLRRPSVCPGRDSQFLFPSQSVTLTPAPDPAKLHTVSSCVPGHTLTTSGVHFYYPPGAGGGAPGGGDCGFKFLLDREDF